jgi:hypothetical protein
LQIFLIILFLILLIGLFLIPGWITINETTNWKPVCSLPFFLYGISLTSITAILVIYYSLKIQTKFTNKRLKRKWIYFNFGIFSYFFVNFGTLVTNYLNYYPIRFVWLILSALTLPTIYLIYYGVGSDL